MPNRVNYEQVMQALISRGIRIPSQPAVLIALQQKLAEEDYSIKEIARIIAHDPGMIAMLFKVARSPVFSNGKALDSIEQVLLVIGIKQTLNLVQAVSLSSSLSDKSRKTFDVFWTRSQEVAKLAALIAADRVSVCNIFPDQAYMAGIFHECGVPVLMLRFPEYAAKMQFDSIPCWPALHEQDELFHVDHASVGYIVARHWKLPDFICKALLYHHDIPMEELGTVRTLVAILQLAIHFYHRIYHTEHPLWDKLKINTLAELGMDADDEQEYFEEIYDRFMM